MSADRQRYRADCERCAGLCCIAFAHVPDNGFPETKPPDQASRHLTADCRCRVFTGLEQAGYTACRAYDCFGAGPLVTDWMQAGASTYEDFRELARLHMLITALPRTTDTKHLHRALEQVSHRYEQTGCFDMDRDTRSLLRQHAALVEDVLQAVRGGGTNEGNDR